MHKRVRTEKRGREGGGAGEREETLISIESQLRSSMMGQGEERALWVDLSGQYGK